MTVQEIENLKRFPKGKFVVSAGDKATMTLCRIPYKKNKRNETKYIYEGNVHYVYTNGKEYRTDFRERTLKQTLQKTMLYFKSRNNQIIRRKQNAKLV
jgi:hypothetical protein